MSTQVTSTFTIDSWDEHPCHQTEDGRKLTRAHVTQTFSGGLDGRGEVEWLMCYRPDSSADFVGLQHFIGRIGGRSGSVVLETRGTFDGQAAVGPLRIVPDSGTDQLAGVSGEGELSAPLGGQASITLTYRFG
jgi:Protein of unknown function (DUF3224)